MRDACGPEELLSVQLLEKLLLQALVHLGQLLVQVGHLPYSVLHLQLHSRIHPL